jgi:aspartyl-tRNA(Asn)/glutamyl-tRNA(Gln) amidotransferase subunit C
MATFTKDELLHLANLSGLPLEDHEIKQFTLQIESILQYVDQLQNVVANTQVPEIRNNNIFRDDIALRQNNTILLAQAPDSDDGYIVVPKILDEK